ncbi:MAG: hypothetical protein KatS3mg102_1518 [Planctomycetota bacterium]|nr:MAG: hypothetical protein KatS3mg102_1518 [Planctomycetota bacterium]
MAVAERPGEAVSAHNDPAAPPASGPPFEPAVTDSQRKVIRDRYLRDAPSIGAWLWGVARNIALAEVLFAGDAAWLRGLCEGLEGVWLERIETAAGPTHLLHVCDGGPTEDERRACFDAFLARLQAAAAGGGAAAAAHRRWALRFYEAMGRWRFLPNSPALMNAGRPLQQLSACFVLPVPDRLDGIMDALKAQALIHQSGGGTGFGFGRLRPAGDLVRSTRGVASGPVEFMRAFDCMTEVIRQGGTRRGANMGVLPVSHPDIRAFITAKQREGAFANFNLSVAVPDSFMAAVRAGGMVALVNPRTGEVVRQESARELFELIASCAWQTGDPGLIFIDRMNEPRSNPTPALGRVEATNPCGEVGMLGYEPCNLGSINLAAFVEGPLGEGRWDEQGLAETVEVAVRLLDDVIEVNRYPLPEIERMAKGNRRIGLGVMGWAEALVKLGIPYDSEQALAEAERVMARIDAWARAASEQLARERGVFPHWTHSVYDPDSPYFAGQPLRVRHCARTSIAPTGTIAIAAGLQGSGIEPFFALAYTRYTAEGLAALARGEQPAPEQLYRECNPLLLELARAHDWFGMGEAQLRARLAAPTRSLRELAGIPEQVARLFPTAHEIHWSQHLRMQAAFQRHTDNAVSKTINLPQHATVADVREAYLMAHALGCKGITVYRDRSKPVQVLARDSCGLGARAACSD